MEFSPPSINLALILPFVVVVSSGIVLMVLDMLIKHDHKQWTAWFSIAGLLLAGGITLATWNTSGGTFTPLGGHPMLVVDGYVHFLNLLFVISGILSILISLSYLGKTAIVERAEYYMLILFSTSGMMLMGAANDLMLVFIALELLSIPLYVLSAMSRPNLESEEAGIKYFLLGAFSSGFLIFGFALIYGATGSMSLPVVAQNFSASDPIALAGLALSLVGLGFKVGVVPFHMWTPDVYEGAPTAVTAFMAVGAKIGAFAALLRLFLGHLPQEAAAVWVPAIAVIAALTMILGNVVALAQTNIKRMLAYSSIAHGGYMMMAVAAGPATGQGVSAALYYLLAYLFTSMGAFAIVVMVERPNNEGLQLDDYKGLAKNNLGYALLLTYFMLSLTGMPLTGGFLGKFFVFKASIDAGLIWLALVGALTSVISAYYYLRVVFYMFMVEGEGVLESHAPLAWTVGIAAVATMILGLFPAPWLALTSEAIVQALPLLIAGG